MRKNLERPGSSEVVGSSVSLMWDDRFSQVKMTPAGPAFLGPHKYLPNEHWDVGRRVEVLFDALQGSGLYARLTRPTFAAATRKQLAGIHSEEYLSANLEAESALIRDRAIVGLLAVGACVKLVESIVAGETRNGYALVRPVGHHAKLGQAGGGCVFANGVAAVRAAQASGLDRVAVVDWDAHHGDGQQQAFYDDPSTLTISLHQNQRFPDGAGSIDARGSGLGMGTNINLPFPMGSGGGAYRQAFERVVLPSLTRFNPDMIIVLSGFDGCHMDPSARLALHSGDYYYFTRSLKMLADTLCGGRLAVLHEGGYSIPYAPMCFLKVVEALLGDDDAIEDPFILRWGADFAAEVSRDAHEMIERAAVAVLEVPSGLDC